MSNSGKGSLGQDRADFPDFLRRTAAKLGRREGHAGSLNTLHSVVENDDSWIPDEFKVAVKNAEAGRFVDMESRCNDPGFSSLLKYPF